MRHLLNTLLTTLAMIPICISFIACNPVKKSSSSLQKAPHDTIIIGLLPTLDCLPFYVAREKGIFSLMGLQVKFVLANSQMDMDGYLAKGYVEIGATDLLRTIEMQNRKEPVRFLAASSREWEVYACRKYRITRPQQLGDRMIGSTRHSVPDLICDSLSQTVIQKKRLLLRPQINNVFIRMRMLDDGQLDAAIMPVPLTQTVKARKHTFVAKAEYANGMAGFAINTKKVKGHSEFVKKILQAYNIAVDSIKAYPSQPLPQRFMAYLKTDSIPVSLLTSSKLAHLSTPDSIRKQLALTWTQKNRIAENSYSIDTLMFSY